MSNGKRVVVAMSGGVDSSVAAAMLVDQGYEVIGITMQVWPDADGEVTEREGGCCSLGAVSDARRVCDLIGIPYYVLNFQDVFEEQVIDRFAAEYAEGRTPNPCVSCNRYVKFDHLMHNAQALEADYLATGHYAKIGYDAATGRHLLLRAMDDNKDQTYALYGMTQDQLSRTMFPLGGYTKPQVRELAEKYGLPTAKKAESMDICFVVQGNYGDFLHQRMPDAFKPGPLLDTAGNVLGEHRGLPYYTIGQRQGLGISVGHPLYVVRLDAANNAVIVGDASEIFSAGAICSDPNWITVNDLTEPLDVTVKIRYHAKEVAATVRPGAKDGLVAVEFAEPQRAVTPGQIAVFYDGDRVVGGCTIEQSVPVPALSVVG